MALQMTRWLSSNTSSLRRGPLSRAVFLADAFVLRTGLHKGTRASQLRKPTASRAIHSLPPHHMSASRRAGQVLGHLNPRSYSTASSEQAGVHVEIKQFTSGAEVATVTVSNPTKLNIVNSSILGQLTTAFNDLAGNPNLRAAILTGGATAPGKVPSFIGGADISEMHQLASADDARAFITRIHIVSKAMRDLPVPVIARVDGFALGAGMEIMAACDLRIVTKKSVFGMPEVKVGIPSVIEAALLPGLIGMGRTRRMLYLAENISAAEAERWGLVEKVVGDVTELDAAVDEWVDVIAGHGPQAIRSQKRLMQKWENCSIDEGVRAGIESYAMAYADGGSEPKDFMGKFVNRRR